MVSQARYWSTITIVAAILKWFGILSSTSLLPATWGTIAVTMSALRYFQLPDEDRKKLWEHPSWGDLWTFLPWLPAYLVIRIAKPIAKFLKKSPPRLWWRKLGYHAYNLIRRAKHPVDSSLIRRIRETKKLRKQLQRVLRDLGLDEEICHTSPDPALQARLPRIAQEQCETQAAIDELDREILELQTRIDNWAKAFGTDDDQMLRTLAKAEGLQAVAARLTEASRDECRATDKTLAMPEFNGGDEKEVEQQKLESTG